MCNTSGAVPIKLHRAVPDSCLKQVVITRKAGNRWFISFQGDDGCEPAPLKGGKAIGIDIGLASLLAFSDGTLIDNPRWLRRSLGKLRRTQRALARKTRFSSRWWKTKRQLESLHWKIGNQAPTLPASTYLSLDGYFCSDRSRGRFAVLYAVEPTPCTQCFGCKLAFVPLDA